MAAKKSAAKGAAKGTAVAKWDERLAALAARQKKTESTAASGGLFIKTRGGQFVIDGGVVPGGKIKGVIVTSILENHWYAGAFDPSTPATPDCYAFGDDAREMAPHEESGQPQAESCHECPLNKFGSADVGKGKACSNSRRLAIVSESDFDDLERAQWRFLNVPPTSARNWKGFVDQIDSVTKNKAVAGVVTEISITPHTDKQLEINFRLVDEIDDAEALQAIVGEGGLVDRADEAIAAPYPKLEEAPQPAPRRGGAGKAAKPAAAPRFAKRKK